MNNKPDSKMRTQEFHNRQFKEHVIQHYKLLIRAAEQTDNETRLMRLNAQLEQIEAGDLSVAKHLIFIVDGSKLYYDKQQKKVVIDQIPYTIL